MLCLLAIAIMKIEDCSSSFTIDHGQGRLTSGHAPVKTSMVPRPPHSTPCWVRSWILLLTRCAGLYIPSSASPPATSSASTSWARLPGSRLSVYIICPHIQFCCFHYHFVPMGIVHSPLLRSFFRLDRAWRNQTVQPTCPFPH